MTNGATRTNNGDAANGLRKYIGLETKEWFLPETSHSLQRDDVLQAFFHVKIAHSRSDCKRCLAICNGGPPEVVVKFGR